MKKPLLVLALGLLASSAFAQSAAKDGQLALLYDVDSTTLTYCRTEGASGGPFDSPIVGSSRIKTVGSSTTVTEFTAGALPFSSVAVGDILVIQTTNPPGAVQTLRAVTAKASGASITVDTAIDLSAAGGFQFGFYKHRCGTTSADGWVAIPTAARLISLTVQYDQGDLDALAVRWECKASGAGAEPVIIYPGESSDCGIGGTLATDRCTFATPGITARLSVVDTAPAYGSCRVGLARVTTDTLDTTTNLEKVTVKVSVR